MSKSKGRKNALGRGLGALIGHAGTTHEPTSPPGAAPEPSPSDATPGRRIEEVPLADLSPSPYQPRHDFDEEKIETLAHSLQEQGLAQPILVRPREDGGYQIVVGERRFRAARSLGWETIAAEVRKIDDARARELALVENLQRDDLNPIEIALAYQEMQNELSLTHDEISKRIGVTRSSITNALRLLELPEEVCELIELDQLRAGHARALLPLPDPLTQIRIARRIAKEGLSVRQVETLVAPRAGGKRKPAHAAPEPNAEIRRLENRLRRHLGTKVTVQDHGGHGRIVVEYYSTDDVARLLDRLGLEDDLL